VVDAQIKSKVATEEEIRRSPWWKRLKRTNKME
jgi:malate dehydrogenase (oxaloacetate-decarboxylating)(NADP+)